MVIFTLAAVGNNCVGIGYNERNYFIMIGTLEYIIGGVLLALAIALIVLIGLQQSKRKGLGNSIAGQGASESYLAKNGIGNKDKSYQKITLVVAIIFVILTLTLYVLIANGNDGDETSGASSVVATSSVASSSAAESSAAESAVESSAAESVAESSAAESTAESTTESVAESSAEAAE